MRVVRVTYAPHEKSPMHGHQGNAMVIVVLKGGGRMHSVNADGSTTDGKTEQMGAVRFVPSPASFLIRRQSARSARKWRPRMGMACLPTRQVPKANAARFVRQLMAPRQ